MGKYINFNRVEHIDEVYHIDYKEEYYQEELEYIKEQIPELYEQVKDIDFEGMYKIISNQEPDIIVTHTIQIHGDSWSYEVSFKDHMLDSIRECCFSWGPIDTEYNSSDEDYSMKNGD